MSTEPNGGISSGGGGAGDFFRDGFLGGLLGDVAGVALEEEVLDPEGDLASTLNVCNKGGDDIRRDAFSSFVSIARSLLLGELGDVGEVGAVAPGAVGA